MRQVLGVSAALLMLALPAACLPTPQCRTSDDCPPPQTCKDDGWCEYPNGKRITLSPDNGGASSSGAAASSSGGGCTVAQLPGDPNTQCLPVNRPTVLLAMGCTLVELRRDQLAGALATTCTAIPNGAAALFDLKSTGDASVTVSVTSDPMSAVVVEDGVCGTGSCVFPPTTFRLRTNATIPLWIVQAPGAGSQTLTVRFDASPWN